MDLKMRFAFVMVLVGNWACEARHLTSPDRPNEIEKNVDVCTFCEEYINLAVKYYAENQTRTEITEVLNVACSELHPLKEQEVEAAKSVINERDGGFFRSILDFADEFCERVKMSQGKGNILLPVKENSCDVCHHAVDEIILLLKDPDTKLEIIEILLKGCNALENYAKKCKAVVFEYGPLILTNVEKYLEKTDICSTIHACKVPSASSEGTLFDDKVMMVTTLS